MGETEIQHSNRRNMKRLNISKRMAIVVALVTMLFAAAMVSQLLPLRTVQSAPVAGKALGSGAAVTNLNPGPAAATNCPPFSFVNNTNLAKNPSFEVVGPNGPSTSWQAGGPDYPPSAANNWIMHTNNARAPVSSKLEPTNVPGSGSAKMLHFIAGGVESGIYQRQDTAPAKLMFSVWIFVKSGHVGIATSGGTSGPAAFSTKHGEWEQLRVCTDGTVPSGYFVIWNQDSTGGDFFVDRAEIRETP
jgi:hypothetical protein